MINYWYKRRQGVSYFKATNSDVCDHKKIDEKLFGHTVKMKIPLLPIEKPGWRAIPPTLLDSVTHTDIHIHTSVRIAIIVVGRRGVFSPKSEAKCVPLRALISIDRKEYQLSNLLRQLVFYLLNSHARTAVTDPQKRSRERVKNKKIKKSWKNFLDESGSSYLVVNLCSGDIWSTNAVCLHTMTEKRLTVMQRCVTYENG